MKRRQTCKAIDDLIADGREEGQRLILIAQVKDGELTIDKAAKYANMTAEEFQKLLNTK